MNKTTWTCLIHPELTMKIGVVCALKGMLAVFPNSQQECGNRKIIENYFSFSPYFNYKIKKKPVGSFFLLSHKSFKELKVLVRETGREMQKRLKK